jgi:hypothetical protein
MPGASLPYKQGIFKINRVLGLAQASEAGFLHLLLYESLLIVSNVFLQGSLMPREATSLVPEKQEGLPKNLMAQGFGQVSSLGLPCWDTLAGSTGFYTGMHCVCPGPRGGEETELQDAGGKNFLKSKCRSPAVILSLPGTPPCNLNLTHPNVSAEPGKRPGNRANFIGNFVPMKLALEFPAVVSAIRRIKDSGGRLAPPWGVPEATAGQSPRRLEAGGAKEPKRVAFWFAEAQGRGKIRILPRP